jgi:hypothetical protein
LELQEVHAAETMRELEVIEDDEEE